MKSGLSPAPISTLSPCGGKVLKPLFLCAAFSLLSGCGDSAEQFRPSEVEASVSESIATVVTVSWETAEPSIGYVQYGPTEEMEFNTPLEEEESESHAVTLLDLQPDTVYYYRVVLWDGDDAGTSEIGTVRTDELPSILPQFDVEGDGHDQYMIVPLRGGGDTLVSILNPAGEIIWYHAVDTDLDIVRARLSVDGESLLYNVASIAGEPEDETEIVRVSLDGSSVESIAVPLLAHDFVEHEDGTLGAIATEYRDEDGASVRGNKLIEITPDGDITEIWNSWDCFDPEQLEGDEPELGWTFANALDYNEAEQAYYVGMRTFSSIAKVNRETAECEWVLGWFGATLELAEGSERFLHQHQFHIFNNEKRVVVFDNDGAGRGTSRVIEYELDLENNTATQIWSYIADPPAYSVVLGDAERIAGGDTFVVWSMAGRIERVNPEGETVWKLESDLGTAFSFTTLTRTLHNGGR